MPYGNSVNSIPNGMSRILIDIDGVEAHHLGWSFQWAAQGSAYPTFAAITKIDGKVTLNFRDFSTRPFSAGTASPT
ncbi:hypothetical protein BH23PLA1_BH23PLA1_30430 [soil metagenome]